jgi:hypothetical protein
MDGSMNLIPVPDVSVSATYVGPSADGGDNRSGKTNQTGVAEGLELAHFQEGPAIWQIYLTPSANSKYVSPKFTSEETMLVILPDGTYFPEQFRIAFKDPYAARLL